MENPQVQRLNANNQCGMKQSMGNELGNKLAMEHELEAKGNELHAELDASPAIHMGSIKCPQPNKRPQVPHVFSR